jgi:hypothetical protein
MDAFAGGVGLGNEFGGEFVVNFWTRVTEKRGGGYRLQGSFFGFAGEFLSLALLRAADRSRVMLRLLCGCNKTARDTIARIASLPNGSTAKANPVR